MQPPITLITPKTGAEATVSDYGLTQSDVPATIEASDLSGAEAIPVMKSGDNGTTWEALVIDGTAIELTATNNSIGIYSPFRIGVTKPVTVNAVGVTITR